jgi:uncharacterized protein (TIGR02246 family)
MTTPPSHADHLDEAVTRVLYQRLLDRWNMTDAAGFAALFAEDGSVVGFDGSQVNGRDEIAKHLGGIFSQHKVAAFIGIVREVRPLSEDVELLRAVAGMVPPGASDIKPETNAVQSLIAVRKDGEWRVALFQNTPAVFHGRPEASAALTEELRRTLKSQPLLRAEDE